MMDGQVMQVASPQQLYHQPATRSVAEFIGDANFFPGTAHGYHVNCELGTLHLQYATEGLVDVLVRPENVKVKPAPGTFDTRVSQILFFGHDQLVSLELASGQSLATRVGPMYNFAVGQPVSIEVTGLVMAYPRIEQI
jgi:iron(III) transport system ATP-binding protein